MRQSAAHAPIGEAYYDDDYCGLFVFGEVVAADCLVKSVQDSAYYEGEAKANVCVCRVLFPITASVQQRVLK